MRRNSYSNTHLLLMRGEDRKLLLLIVKGSSI